MPAGLMSINPGLLSPHPALMTKSNDASTVVV